MRWWERLLCRMEIHDGFLVDEFSDPYRHLAGHQGTEACLRCNKIRRVVGNPEGKLHVLPWVEREKLPHDHPWNGIEEYLE